MHLKKTQRPNGRIYLSITDSYYDKQKKTSRSKTIESLGYLDELEKQYADPIAHFSRRVEELRQEKKIRQSPINFTFYESDRLCTNDNLRKNFGYTALSKVYHELGIHTFLNNRQRHSKEKVYRCLSLLAKHNEKLQIWLNHKIKENYGRDTTLIYYDVTNYYFESGNI